MGAPRASAAKTSGMAIAALVVSIFFCIPICGPIGLILGIIALIQINKSPDQLGGKGLAIAAIIVGGLGVVLFVGSVVVGIPAYHQYMARAKSSEAENRISEMFRSAVAYYGHEAIALGADAQPIPPQFPVSTPLTPSVDCCSDPDGRCNPWDYGAAQWITPTWHALNFAISDSHYYRYEFVSDGTTFTARAIGDLDCDGVLSTFERTGTVNPDGDVQGGRGITRVNPTE